MGISTYLVRLNRLHFFIKRRQTGTPCEFAQKMNLSRSALLKDLSEMKNLGFPIEYDKTRGTYKYNVEKLGAISETDLSPDFLKKIFGGKKKQNISALSIQIFYDN